MDNTNQNGSESKNIQNLRAIINRFSKGARKNAKRVLGAALTATLLTSCNPAVQFEYGETQLEEQAVQLSEPYSKTIGNRDYVFHNYIGEQPNIIASTAKTDVANYLDKGVSYLQKQFDNFNRSLINRPNLQRYFAQFDFDFSNLPTKHYHHEITAHEKMDDMVNKINDICTPILHDIASYLNTDEEREAFNLCYRVLANENYKEAIGVARDKDNAMMRKYSDEQAQISNLWSQNNVLKSVPLDRDIHAETFKYQRVTDEMDTLLLKSAMNMRDTTLLQDIKLEDLQGVINLHLNISSLTAMHDLTTALLQHKNCQINQQKNLILHRNMSNSTPESDLTF